MSILLKRKIDHLKLQKEDLESKQIKPNVEIKQIEKEIKKQNKLYKRAVKNEEFYKDYPGKFLLCVDKNPPNRNLVPVIINLNMYVKSYYVENTDTYIYYLKKSKNMYNIEFNYVHIHKFLNMDLYKEELERMVHDNMNDPNFENKLYIALKQVDIYLDTDNKLSECKNTKKTRADVDLIMYCNVSMLNIREAELCEYTRKFVDENSFKCNHFITDEKPEQFWKYKIEKKDKTFKIFYCQ